MINGLLLVGFGAFAVAIASRLTGTSEHADECPDVWDRIGSLMKALGPLIVLAGMALVVQSFARRPGPAPIVVTHTLSSPEFGFHATLPSTWSVESSPTGNDFMAVEASAGAVLVGTVTVNAAPGHNLEAAIDKIVEEERARSGAVEKLSSGSTALSSLDARWIDLSLPNEGEQVRMKAIVAQKGPQTLTLRCRGAAPAQHACAAVLRTVIMAR